MDKQKSRDYFLLAIGIIALFLFLISLSFAIDLFNLSFSYEFEQFWWFLTGTSLGGLYIILIIFVSRDFKKKLKVSAQTENSRKLLEKLNLRWRLLAYIGLFLILVITLINIYLKSFLPMRDYELYINLTYPIAILPYIVYWIGTVLIVISLILLFIFFHYYAKFSTSEDE